MSQVVLQPKQELAFTSDATEVLYGGAAGGGKSYLMRVSAIRWCCEVPGVQVYLFRRTLPDLRDNHLRGPSSFQVLLHEYIASGHVKHRTVENEFEFWNGSILHLCYCDSENDVEKYRGAEIHILMMDELVHFSDYQYRFLRSRVRIAGLTIPEKYRAKLPRIECASNPGSIGHAWVKRAFITPKPECEVWRTSPEEGGMLRQFIPAKLADNPYLTRDDPNYADRLRGLGADSLIKGMLDGDWNIIAGQAFEKLSKEKHCIEPFEPPEDWLCFGSFDWGSTRPFSYGMWCVSDGDALLDGRKYPSGALIRFNEFYGWNGKPNEGLRMEVREVAEELLKLEAGRRMAYRIADSSMWKVDGGPSMAEGFNKARCYLRPAPKGPGSRHNGYIEVRQRIAGGLEGPMLYATKNCHDGFWRTMPDLVMDEHKYGINSEQIDTSQEDHCFAVGTKVFGGVIGETGEILGADKWVHGQATKKRMAEVVIVEFDDGDSVICTPDHKFCTKHGWMEAVDLIDEVMYNVLSTRRAQWLLSSVLSVRNFLVSNIIFAGFIFRGKGFGYTDLCGNTITAISLLDGTSTTLTKTGQIIQSKILTWFDRATIFPIIQKEQTTRSALSSLRMHLRSGMGQKKGESGTQSKAKEMWRSCTLKPFRRFVRIAVNCLMQLGLTNTALCFAVLTARTQRCVSVKPLGKIEVSCFKVSDYTHAFALESGTLVHNCSDDVMYACTSRPWTRQIEKTAPPPDRWMRFEDKTEDSWRTT